MMRRIVLATKNPGKVREIGQVLASLGVEVVSLDSLERIEEPEENGDTFAENARDKAMYYARATGLWCLADDSGLVVDALGGAPGVYSARYAAERCDGDAGRETIDRANNDKLLDALADMPDEKRLARFVCSLAMADGEAVLLESSGTIEGRIRRQPVGENGFGYDPLFFVPSLNKTTAQLSADEKNAVSHRGQAVRQFAAKLKKHLAEDGE